MHGYFLDGYKKTFCYCYSYIFTNLLITIYEEIL